MSRHESDTQKDEVQKYEHEKARRLVKSTTDTFPYNVECPTLNSEYPQAFPSFVTSRPTTFAQEYPKKHHRRRNHAHSPALHHFFSAPLTVHSATAPTLATYN